MPLDPERRNLSEKVLFFDVRFVSDPSRASQKFRPLYRPIPRNLYMKNKLSFSDK